MPNKDTPPAFGRSMAVGKINAILANATSSRDERVAILETALAVAVKARDNTS